MAIPRAQQLISIFWPSFLVAGLGTIIFFAAIDPREMVSPAWFVNLGRLEAYTVGFLFFWVLMAGACFLSCYFQSPEDRICASAPTCPDRT
ncbi:MAG: hypothetical protein GY726_13170 [Proteobacteria bacterium]|nr:hypothetical protein [Pseudomonadota bacterium]